MSRRLKVSLALLAVLVLGAAGGRLLAGAPGEPSLRPDPVERGRYLVNAMACADCHVPWHMGAQGPEPDMSKGYSGHPEDLDFPPAPKLPPGPWVVSVAATNTAWAGPWGTSFTANLTPDVETGIGAWTEENFVQAIRTGRHMGVGRPILPPMPYFAFRNLDDDDLKAMFAYLKSLPARRNRVPAPLPPVAAEADQGQD